MNGHDWLATAIIWLASFVAGWMLGAILFDILAN